MKRARYPQHQWLASSPLQAVASLISISHVCRNSELIVDGMTHLDSGPPRTEYKFCQQLVIRLHPLFEADIRTLWRALVSLDPVPYRFESLLPNRILSSAANVQRRPHRHRRRVPILPIQDPTRRLFIRRNPRRSSRAQRPQRRAAQDVPRLFSARARNER
jgi:hypothetical protein